MKMKTSHIVLYSLLGAGAIGTGIYFLRKKNMQSPAPAGSGKTSESSLNVKDTRTSGLNQSITNGLASITGLHLSGKDVGDDGEILHQFPDPIVYHPKPGMNFNGQVSQVFTQNKTLLYFCCP